MKLLGIDDRVSSSPDGLDLGVKLTSDERDLIENELPSIFIREPQKAWLHRLLEADICAIPVLHPGEVFDEPQAVHNAMVVEVDDPVLGPVQQVAPASKFLGTPGGVKSAAPTIGQHSEEILGALQIGITPRAPSSTRPLDDRPLLEGVKVLDLGHYYAGPYSSRLLADLGADVIKLEPVLGDQLRGLERGFSSAQAGKRCIAANLKDPELRSVARKLSDWADIVHHNLRPGAAERLGLGYEQVRATNPPVVYLHAPGWGTSGPNVNLQSFAPQMSGYVGVGYEVAGQFNPPLFPVANEDSGNGMLGAVSLLMALLHRQRHGEGQLIENPQLNAAMAHIAHVVRHSDGSVLGAGSLDPLQLGTGPLHRLYQTADGWLCIVATADRHFEALSRALSIDLAGDERFATRQSRSQHSYALEGLLTDSFRSQPTQEWIARLRDEGVPVVEPSLDNNVKYMNDPENRRTGRVAEFSHPRYGRVRELAILVRVSGARVPVHRGAPELGEHTDTILSWLGFGAEKIAELRSRNAIR
jgi:crotonobetainyl-CoA:carnitine CoA-transferase CaiB-like acyl-CoA transferase